LGNSLGNLSWESLLGNSLENLFGKTTQNSQR
jgi:hypothetical protein